MSLAGYHWWGPPNGRIQFYCRPDQASVGYVHFLEQPDHHWEATECTNLGFIGGHRKHTETIGNYPSETAAKEAVERVALSRVDHG